MKKSQRRYRGGFTLIEILVVLSIIALLAAIFFPAFSRARENGRQANCATNLKQIYFAVQQYFQDERAYPDSLVDLLPEGSDINSGGTSAKVDANAVGYLKSGSSLLICQNDDTNSTLPRSSYGSLNKDLTGSYSTGPNASDYVWNYWGYDAKGFAYATAFDAKSSVSSGSTLLANPVDDKGTVSTSDDTPLSFKHEITDGPSNKSREENVLRYSLANKYADPSTIITHCVYHRHSTADNLAGPGDLYTDATKSKNARDVVLRLDGSARSVDVSEWKGQDRWRVQSN